MPRKGEGARLWLRQSGQDPVWVIKDTDGVRRSTGCGAADRAGAERALQAYLAEKHKAHVRPVDLPLDQISVSDVLALYGKDVGPGVGRPVELAGRLKRLILWWAGKSLADIKRSTCLAYAETRTPPAGRRELEDLRAAIGHYMAEGNLRYEVKVILPPKSKSRTRYLTREEVAALLMHCWRHRELQRGVATRRHTRRHIARFVLVGLYTGTRSGAICTASFEREEGCGWVDLAAGVFHRRPEDEEETKKRRPPVRLPGRLLAHLRRWRANGQRYVVEHNGRPVDSVKRAFGSIVADLGWKGVSAHTLRHTTITWAMQSGELTAAEVGAFAGMTERMVEEVYGHHHPDYQSKVAEVLGRRRGVPKRTDTYRNEAQLLETQPEQPAGIAAE